jgi:excisionase family DNA binding protein
MTLDSNEILLSARQAATLLGVTERTILRWSKAGMLTARRFGIRTTRYRKADVLAMARVEAA